MRTYESPIFQHRHYALVAKAIADIQFSEEARTSLISGFANLFESDNVNFSRSRFFDAARGQPNGKDKR